MDKNKRFAELAGIFWHECLNPNGFCSCGLIHNRKLWPDNPDFVADPREVLKVMRGLGSHKWVDFIKNTLISNPFNAFDTAKNLIEGYFLDTTGLARDKGIRWMKGKEK